MRTENKVKLACSVAVETDGNKSAKRRKKNEATLIRIARISGQVLYNYARLAVNYTPVIHE